MILRADARNLPIQDGSVDLIVTSPPYFALRSYTDGGQHYAGQVGAEPTPSEYVDALIECTREMIRVLKPSGSLWLNLGDKYGRVGGVDLKARPMNAGARARQATRPTVGVQDKSLMGLPWRYALRCIGGYSALNDPDVVKLLLRDVALGVLTLAEAESIVDELAVYPYDDLGLILRAEVIWSKPNGLPESVTDRVRRSHEQWFHFTRSPRYYSAVDRIREPHNPDTHRLSKVGATAMAGRNVSMNGGAAPWSGPNALGALPGSVWTVATQPLKVPAHLGIDHFASFPMEFPRRIIQGWSPQGVCTGCGEGRRPVASAEYDVHGPIALTDKARQTELQGNTFATRALGRATRTTHVTGEVCACPDTSAPTTPGVVLDPFGGTGTVALVASALGRTGISVDLSADYCRLARWRTSDPAQRAAALEVEKPPVQVVDQGDLFSLLEVGEGVA